MVITKTNHIHKYHQVKLGNKGHLVMKCAMPGCTHFIRMELAENQLSICWRCDNPFVMTKGALKLKRPHCIPCTKSKVKVKIELVNADESVRNELLNLLEKKVEE